MVHDEVVVGSGRVVALVSSSGEAQPFNAQVEHHLPEGLGGVVARLPEAVLQGKVRVRRLAVVVYDAQVEPSSRLPQRRDSLAAAACLVVGVS